MIYYKLIKVTINVLGLVELIFNIIPKHYGILDYIIRN